MGIFDSKGAKILVVDDNEEIVAVLVEYLTKVGYEAHPAYNGKEALDIFEKNKFQMVVTDLEMPEIDGMQLIEKVKAIDEYAVIIVITGYGTIERAVQAIKKGAYDFITKPVSLQGLEVVINRGLERYFIYKKLTIFRRMFFTLATIMPILILIAIAITYLVNR